MRDICGILGVNRSSFYYQHKEDPSEVSVLCAEIEKLAGRYPRYGYRRIRQLLLRQGYTVGTRRVARLMKEKNLLVSVKRACQTTKSLQWNKPWSNLLETLDVSHQDQVWVADITLCASQGTFHLCLPAHGCFYPDDQGFLSAQSAPEPISDAQASQRSLMPKRPRDTSFGSGRAVSFKCLYRNAPRTWH